MQTAPILLLVFNRPEKTKCVFDVIKKIEPKKLYIAADGPRINSESDSELCKKTRDIILSDISWDCTVTTLFREKNLGCKEAVSSAITWFFSHENEGIILEDDCVPNQDFFRFCTELLEKYRDDKRIFMISGDNFLNSRYKPKESYYFSLQTHIWGWATWKRAWDYYDVKMNNWPKFKTNKYLNGLYKYEPHIKGWTNLMDQTYHGIIQTWDYQWQFSCWAHNGLSIMPTVNLISNIGNDYEGTHVNLSKNKHIYLSQNINFPLDHPIIQLRDYQADEITLNLIFPKRGLPKKLIEMFKYYYNRVIKGYQL